MAARKEPPIGSLAHERKEMRLIKELADMHRDLKKVHGRLAKAHRALTKAATRKGR